MEREVNNTNNLKITEGIQTKLFDLKIDPNKQSKTFNVSDRELLRVVKEEKRFPIPFSRPVKLSVLLKFYNKYWNGDFTDDEDGFD
jgi:hypothetical protein